MLLSIVIPIHNEADNLRQLIEELRRQVPSDLDLEIVFVDDGSTDNSRDILIELAKNIPEIKVVALSRNFGHQAAIYAGLEMARGNAVITMDADLQDPPECIPKFIEAWKAGNKVVYGRRIKRENDSWFKRISARAYYRLLTVSSNVSIPENVGDFRLIDRQVVDCLNQLPRKEPFVRGMIAYLGFGQSFIDYDRPKRQHGETKYSVSKMFSLALDGLLSYSMMPLKIGLLLGILSIGTGMFFLFYIIWDTLFNNEVYPLYKWLVVVLFMFTGLLFILIWILAEYVSRTYRQNQQKPLYVIEKTFEAEP
ncbi:MAG: glycosyltransferase family 2 protein [Cryomorphaceae bacterium]|nr:glycosyltransferase family 2 protein [Cryomorphaceae bacterium]